MSSSPLGITYTSLLQGHLRSEWLLHNANRLFIPVFSCAYYWYDATQLSLMIHKQWERIHWGNAIWGFKPVSRPQTHWGWGIQLCSLAITTTGDKLMRHLRFIMHTLQVIKIEKGEGRKVSSGMPPTHQRHCNWPQDMSVSLDHPVMSEVIHHMKAWKLCLMS